MAGLELKSLPDEWQEWAKDNMIRIPAQDEWQFDATKKRISENYMVLAYNNVRRRLGLTVLQVGTDHEGKVLEEYQRLISRRDFYRISSHGRHSLRPGHRQWEFSQW